MVLNLMGLQSINIENNRRLYLFYPQMLCVRNLELKVKLMYLSQKYQNSYSSQLHPITWSYHHLLFIHTSSTFYSPSSFCLSGSFLSFIVQVKPHHLQEIFVHIHTHSPPPQNYYYSVSLPYNLFSTSAFNIYHTFSVCVM